MTNEGVASQIRVLHYASNGRLENDNWMQVLVRNSDWIVTRMDYDVTNFGIPPRFRTVESHFFRGKTTWVSQFVDLSCGTAFRTYYNINEPLEFGQGEIIIRDLELDILEDAVGMQVIDIEEFRKSNLSARQIVFVKEALYNIISGLVYKWCRETPFPLRSFYKE